MHRGRCHIGDVVAHAIAGHSAVYMVARAHTGSHARHVRNGARLAHIERNAAELHRAHARGRNRTAQTCCIQGTGDIGEAGRGGVNDVGIDNLDGADVLHLQAVAHQITDLDRAYCSRLHDTQQGLVGLDHHLHDGIVAIARIDPLADAVTDVVLARRRSRRHGYAAGNGIQYRHGRIATNRRCRCQHLTIDQLRREADAIESVVFGIGIAHHLLGRCTAVGDIAVILGIDGRCRHPDGDACGIAQGRHLLVAYLIGDHIIAGWRARRHAHNARGGIQHRHRAPVDGGGRSHDLADDIADRHGIAIERVIGISIACIGCTQIAFDIRQMVVNRIDLADHGSHHAADLVALGRGPARAGHAGHGVLHRGHGSRRDSRLVFDRIGSRHGALGQGQLQGLPVEPISEAAR